MSIFEVETTEEFVDEVHDRFFGVIGELIYDIFGTLNMLACVVTVRFAIESGRIVGFFKKG